jgi:signal transduction histidine kinase
MALCVAAGEALRTTLPYGRGQMAVFGHGDAAILAGLVLLTPFEITLGACIGAVIMHAFARTDTLKAAFNLAQLTLATTGASLLFTALTGPGVALSPTLLPAYIAASALFMLLNASLVATVVATVTQTPVRVAILRLLPPTAVLSTGSACLGLLALGLLDAHVYLLPVLGVPLVFLTAGSRQQIDAQLRVERSQQLVKFERRLDDATDVGELDAVLIDGIHALANATAAVWRGGQWVSTVPENSGECPVVAGGTGMVKASVRELGPNATAQGVAINMDDAVVVAWGGDLGDIQGTEDWIERLARSATDHAERARAQHALLRERATLQRVVSGTQDGIYLLDADKRIRLVNPAMAMLLASRAGAVEGSLASDSFGPGDWSSPGVRDIERQTSDGAAVWRVSVASVTDDGAEEVGIGVVHDVSDERHLARMKDDMLAIVSHELRTPLTPIRAAAQLLNTRWRSMADPQREQLLEQVSDRAEHLTRLVEDLLLVAQMSSEDGQAPVPRLEEVDIAAIVAHNVGQHQSSRVPQISYEGPERLHAVTDVRRLRQVLDNLIDNACKFSMDASPVKVRVEGLRDTVAVSVIDYGRGIRRADLKRIFDKFERLEDPLVMQTSGAGLGLYIVRSLVTALGGELQVDSTFGLGTTMTVTLPSDPRVTLCAPAPLHLTMVEPVTHEDVA